jgi:hypothetical protein
MNEKDELRLQRLIDGEMGDWERRAFLAGLDDEPDGWRLVALAFLEDQALRGALASDVPAATPSGPGRALPWFRPLALAAGLLLTLGLGLALGRLWPGTPRLAEFDTARLQSPGCAPSEDPGAPIPVPPGEGWEGDFLPAGAIAYELTIERKGDTFEIRTVPVWGSDNPDLSSMPGPEDELPEALRSALAGSGYRLESDTQYWPVQSDDGRQVVVPVQTVAVAPHGQ